MVRIGSITTAQPRRSRREPLCGKILKQERGGIGVVEVRLDLLLFVERREITTMAKSYSTLRTKITPEARAKAEEQTRIILQEMPLQELNGLGK